MIALSDTMTETLKTSAIEFLRLAAEGNPREGFRRYAAKDFRHHNPYFKGDAESMIAAMEQNSKENPEKTLTVKLTMQDGDLVLVHSHIRQKPDEKGYAVAHMFRFRKERIVEMWDVGQPIPADSPNEYGMF